MLPEWTVVGFSGHRKMENPAASAEGIRKTLAQLDENYGPLTSISSAASGGDTLFLEEIARRNSPFRLVLPLPRESFEHDFTQEEWQRVLPFLNNAIFVDELIVRGKSNEETRREAFMEGGVLTVEAADVMIFLWNGKPAAGLGGTGNVVEYARRLGRPLIVIDPASGDVVVEERLEKLLPRKENPANWDEKNPRNAVEQCFNKFREAANPPRALRPRALILWIIACQILAAMVGMYLLKKEDAWTNLLEVGLLAAAASLVFFHHNQQHKWIEGRLRTELCRSFLATWDLCRGAAFLPRMGLRGCEKLAHSLQIAWCLDRKASRNFIDARELYLANRIQEQINYFKGSCERAERHTGRLMAIAWVTLLFAVLFALFALVALLWVHDQHLALRTNLHYLSFGLPIISATVLTYVTVHEHSRRAFLYKEMVSKLEDLRGRLEVAPTSASLCRLVMEAEDCLLKEVAEWYSFVRFTGVLH